MNKSVFCGNGLGCLFVGLGLLPFEVIGAAAAFLDFICLLAHDWSLQDCDFGFGSGSMKRGVLFFNAILLVAVFFTGCKSWGYLQKQPDVMLAIFAEYPPNRNVSVMQISVFRANPRTVSIAQEPVLTLIPKTLRDAQLVELDGGILEFSLELTSLGTKAYQDVLRRYRQQRLFILVSRRDPDDKKKTRMRCIGVIASENQPDIQRIRFSPDSDEAEAVEIVEGLVLDDFSK